MTRTYYLENEIEKRWGNQVRRWFPSRRVNLAADAGRLAVTHRRLSVPHALPFFDNAQHVRVHCIRTPFSQHHISLFSIEQLRHNYSADRGSQTRFPDQEQAPEPWTAFHKN